MTFDEICRRASGRRRYNAERQKTANNRRSEVARLLCEYGRSKRGVRARIARELGVSKATVSRDASHPAMPVYLFIHGGRMKDYRALKLMAGW